MQFGKREPKGRKLFDITKLITGAANEKDRFHIDKQDSEMIKDVLKKLQLSS